ncbi:MAG: peptide ABC transporter substrate-binding protein [Clostridia bacterium]|nr:peptide ABC transporter substrate-binding protein [Clostridia bacterium]
MTQIRKITALLLCLLCLLGLTGCEEEEVSPENHFFTYDLAGEPDNLDPQTAQGEDAWTVIQNLYEGLCRTDASGRALPGVAERWEPNDDATQFTFYLRDGVCWSNGEPLTAQDFAYALQRALTPATRCPSAQDLFCIRGAQAFYEGTGTWDEVGIRVESDDVIRFELTRSLVDFPAETAKSIYMPCNEAFFLSTGGRYGKEDDDMLTNGPFRLRSFAGWMYRDYIRLVRSETYCGEETVWPTGLMLDIGASSNPIKELTEGTIQAAKLTPAQAKAAQAQGLQLVTFAESTTGIVFNCQKAHLQSAQTRLALVTALARDTLTPLYPADTAPADGIIPGAVTIAGQGYRAWAGVCADAVAAQTPAQLLAAGLQETGHRELPASLKVLCLDTPENRRIANELLAAWRTELGYYFNIEVVATERILQQRLQAGDYYVAIARVAPTENRVTAVTDRVCALSGYTDAEYDRLCADITRNPQENAQALERLLTDAGVFFPLYTESSTYAQGKTVTGLIIRPFGGGLDFRRAGRT